MLGFLKRRETLIRRAEIDDMPAMFRISQHSFDIPWSQTSFEAEFSKQYSESYLYTQNSQVVAYLIIWAIQNEGEIVSLAVDKGWRGRGIGLKLLSHAFLLHREIKLWRLEVAEHNHVAQSLYEKCGFARVRLIKNYYGQENAVQMLKTVSGGRDV